MVRDDFINRMELNHFLIDNFENKIPDYLFIGSCFSGIDYIMGHDGALQYEKNAGREIPFGSDGTYVCIRKVSEEKWHLGTDFNGYFHVYYYQCNGRYIISSSFSSIIDYLKINNLYYSINYTQLQSWSSNIDMVRTQMCFKTSVNEIKLLPSNCHLQLNNDSVVVQENKIENKYGSSYKDKLTAFIDVWRSRYATLILNSNKKIQTHLTGGLDSRVIFSFVNSIISDFGEDAKKNLKILSIPRNVEDFEIASSICEKYGLKINHEPEIQSNTSRLTPEECYRMWEKAHLGCYSHIVFPLNAPNPNIISFPGLGGECNRHVYAPDITNFINEVGNFYSRWWKSAALHNQWVSDLIEADDIISKNTLASQFAIVRNHREFRDRFHSGHSNFWNYNCISLSSKAAFSASNALDEQSFSNGQFLYDVLYSLNTELAELAYDSPEKMPSAEILSNLTKINYEKNLKIGNIYGDNYEEKTLKELKIDNNNPTKVVYEKLIDARSSKDVVALFGFEFIENEIKIIEANVEKGVRNVHEQGRRTHAILLANKLL